MWKPAISAIANEVPRNAASDHAAAVRSRPDTVTSGRTTSQSTKYSGNASAVTARIGGGSDGNVSKPRGLFSNPTQTSTTPADSPRIRPMATVGTRGDGLVFEGVTWRVTDGASAKASTDGAQRLQPMEREGFNRWSAKLQPKEREGFSRAYVRARAGRRGTAARRTSACSSRCRECDSARGSGSPSTR